MWWILILAGMVAVTLVGVVVASRMRPDTASRYDRSGDEPDDRRRLPPI
jgi:hypothetical protein